MGMKAALALIAAVSSVSGRAGATCDGSDRLSPWPGNSVTATALVEGITPPDQGPTIEVVIRVVGDTPAAGAPPKDVASVAVVCLDSGFAHREELTGGPHRPRPHVPVGGEARLRVPVDRRLGFSAYSRLRGYAEVAVEAGTWSDAARLPAAVEEVPVVLLRLAAPTEPGRLEVREGKRGDHSVHVEVKLPLTAVPVASASCGSLEALELPPGSFDVRIRPFRRMLCMMGAPRREPALGCERECRIRSGEVTVFRHHYGSGSSLQLRLVLDSMKPGALGAARQTERNLQYQWRKYRRLDRPAEWFAYAVVQRRDPETGDFSRPRRVVWGWDERSIAQESFLIPIDRDLYSVPLYGSGEYALTIEGPRLQPMRVSIHHEPDKGSETGVIRVQLKAGSGAK